MFRDIRCIVCGTPIEDSDSNRMPALTETCSEECDKIYYGEEDE